MLRRLVVLFLVLASAVTVSTVAVGLSENFVDPCEEGHAWEEIFNVGATCTEEGIVVKQCAVCGEKSEETTPALGHDLATVPGSAVDPTCTDKGCTATTKCTRTNCDYEVKGESIPAINHKYGDIISVGDGTHKWVCENDSKHEVISECKGGTATCTEKAVCEECGGAYGEYANHAYANQVVEDALHKEATCTEKAVYFVTCSVCGEKGTDTFVDENGAYGEHTYGTLIPQVDATCGSTGTQAHYECACGKIFDANKVETTLEALTIAKDATKHEWDDGVGTDATCTVDGFKTFTCIHGCGATEDRVITATGHNYEGVVTDPTCTDAGYTTYTCSACGDNYIDDETQALGHTPGEVVVENKTDSTCTVAGHQDNVVYCATCGTHEISRTTVDLPLAPHTGSETINTCATCGSEITVDDIHAMTKTLAEGKYLTGKYQLSGTIVSISGKNILINVSGSTAKFEITAYSTIGDAVANLVVGDVITVSGSIKNYYGTIEFEKPTLDSVYHTVAIEEGANGSVTTNVEGLIANGTSLTITITPDTGYELDNFYVDGAVVEIENNTYTFVVEKSVKIEVTFKVIGSQGEVVPTIVNKTIAEFADDNNWANGTKYLTFNLDSVITVTANGGSNTGKYYTSGENWRIYQGETGQFTISAADGYKIISVTVGYVVDKTGVMTLNGNNVATGTEVDVNGTSITFGVGNTTEGVTNGQVRVNELTVRYVPVSSTPACTHENTEVTKVGQASTCEVAGWTDEITCTSCGEIVTASVDLPLADHTEGQAERDNVVDSSCSAEGSYDSVVKCTVCDKELSREEGLVIEKKPHTEVTDDAVEPDCTNTGLTAGSHCSACGEVIVAQQEVPVDEDAHAWNEGEVTTDPGCTTVGEMTYTCTLNGEHTKTEEVSATGHKDENPVDGRCDACGTSLCAEHDYDEGVVSLEPTCEDEGVKTYTCSVCGDIKTETLDALGHAWDNGVISTPATCESVGEKTYTCANDNSHTKTEEIAIDENAHAWNEGVVTTPATCVSLGEKTYTCTLNGEHTKTEEIAIDENAHAWNEGVVTTPATCVSVGEKTYTCTLNGEHTKTEEIAIDETAHAYGNWNEEVSADCTTNGTKGHYACSNEGCGKYFDAEYNVIADIVILASHDYVNGECTKCHALNGAETFIASKFGYTNSQDVPRVDGKVATLVFAQGTHSNLAPKYYDSGEGVRPYAGNTITISAGCNINKIIFTFSGSSYSGNMKADVGTYSVSETTGTWTGNAKSVVFTAGATGRIQKIVVYYACDHENTLSENTVEATCTTNGYTTYTCGTCSHSYDGNYTDPKGHSYTEVLTEGYTDDVHTVKCACGDTTTEEHTYTDGVCACGKEKPAAQPVTVKMSSFSTVNGNVGGDSNVTYTTAKGGGTSAPVVNSNAIRLYQNSAGTGGGTITISAVDGYKIQSVTIGSSMKTTIAYTLDDETTKSSNAELAANGKYTVSDLTNDSITFYCMGTTSSTRLYVNYLEVTYIEA